MRMSFSPVTVEVTTRRREVGIIGSVRIIGFPQLVDPIERWKPVAGHPEYLVSTEGRVHSFRQDKSRGRLLNPATNADGYPVVVLAGKTRYVHDLVMTAFVGPKPAGLQVRHLHGLKGGNALWNLSFGTQSQNMRDAVRHGTHPQSRKTHCPQDHLLAGANLCADRTRRKCRTCHNDRARAARRAA